MVLPVSNREDAYGYVVLATSPLIVLLVVSIQFFLELIPVYIGLACIIIVYAIFILRKQNIKSLAYENKHLIVNHNNSIITIPNSKIKSIKRGIGGLDIKLKLTITYKIRLKESFPFGNILWITYRTHNTTEEFVEEDPYELKVLKSELNL